MKRSLINQNTRLFAHAYPDERYWYLGTCALWRVMMPRNVLIVKSRFSHLWEINKINGRDLLVLHGEYGGNPSKFEFENVIMKFCDCQINRTWMLDVAILEPRYAGILNYNAEFKFNDYWLKDETVD